MVNPPGSPVADMRTTWRVANAAGVEAGQILGLKSGVWVGLLAAVGAYLIWNAWGRGSGSTE